MVIDGNLENTKIQDEGHVFLSPPGSRREALAFAAALTFMYVTHFSRGVILVKFR